MTSKREDIFTPEQLADFDYEKEHAPKRRRWYSLRIGITKTERFEADPAAEVERVLRLMLSGDASGPAGSVPDHIRAQIAEHSTPLVEIDARITLGISRSRSRCSPTRPPTTRSTTITVGTATTSRSGQAARQRRSSDRPFSTASCSKLHGTRMP
jgi:hypothetical protein